MTPPGKVKGKNVSTGKFFSITSKARTGIQCVPHPFFHCKISQIIPIDSWLQIAAWPLLIHEPNSVFYLKAFSGKFSYEWIPYETKHTPSLRIQSVNHNFKAVLTEQKGYQVNKHTGSSRRLEETEHGKLRVPTCSKPSRCFKIILSFLSPLYPLSDSPFFQATFNAPPRTACFLNPTTGGVQ